MTKAKRDSMLWSFGFVVSLLFLAATYTQTADRLASKAVDWLMHAVVRLIG